MLTFVAAKIELALAAHGTPDPTMPTPILLPAGTYFLGNPRFLLNETQLSAITGDGVFEFNGKKIAVTATPDDKKWHHLFPRIGIIPMSLRPDLDDRIHYDYINSDAGKIVTFDSDLNIVYKDGVVDIESGGSHTKVDMAVESPYDIKLVCNDASYRMPF